MEAGARPSREAKSIDKPVVMITGSSGLIGSAVGASLADGYAVVGLDVKAPPTGDAGVDFIQCDLTERESVARALHELSLRYGTRLASVVHLAAYYDFSGAPSPLYQELTVKGTARLLDELASFEVEQFVFSSSLLVMKPADEEGIVLSESSATEGEWDYPRSKLAAEEVIRRRRGSIPAVILRLAGVYDDECHSPPISQQIARIYEKKLESYVFPGDADHGQPFVHLDDAVHCFRKVIERRAALGDEEVFLIAEPDVASYRQLQERIGELVHGQEWPAIRVPKAAAKVGAWAREKMSSEETFIKPWMIELADDHYPVETARARERLGWEPRHRLLDELPAMVESLRRDPAGWFREHDIPVPDDLVESRPRSNAAHAGR